MHNWNLLESVSYQPYMKQRNLRIQMFCALRSSRIYDFDTMRLFCLFIFGMALTLSAFEVKAWTFPLENMNEQQSPQMKRWEMRHWIRLNLRICNNYFTNIENYGPEHSLWTVNISKMLECFLFGVPLYPMKSIRHWKASKIISKCFPKSFLNSLKYFQDYAGFF